MNLSKETLRHAPKVTLAVAIGLGLTACGQQEVIPNEGQTEVKASTANSSPQIIDDYQDFGIKSIFTESGKRITVFGDPTPNDRGGLTDNIAFCDGPDLVEMPMQFYADGGNSVITRSVGHAACLDGRLDPSDFDKK